MITKEECAWLVVGALATKEDGLSILDRYSASSREDTGIHLSYSLLTALGEVDVKLYLLEDFGFIIRKTVGDEIEERLDVVSILKTAGWNSPSPTRTVRTAPPPWQRPAA
jgi:hypothetical protein